MTRLGKKTFPNILRATVLIQPPLTFVFSPLCIEEFDLSDKNFKPCPCGYQVRRILKILRATVPLSTETLCFYILPNLQLPLC